VVKELLLKAGGEAKAAREVAQKVVKLAKVDLGKNLDKFLGVRVSSTALPRRRTRSARSPASPGPRSAASC
jgi:hypothetical protein